MNLIMNGVARQRLQQQEGGREGHQQDQ